MYWCFYVVIHGAFMLNLPSVHAFLCQYCQYIVFGLFYLWHFLMFLWKRRVWCPYLFVLQLALSSIHSVILQSGGVVAVTIYALCEKYGVGYTGEVCQTLPWRMKKNHLSIRIWYIVTDLVPLRSVYQAPSHESKFSLLALTILASLSMQFTVKCQINAPA